jgi:hypothetical protein
MNAQGLSIRQQQEIERQVDGLFVRNAAFRHLSPSQQDQIRRDTAEIVKTLSQRGRPAIDPYAEAMQAATNAASSGPGGINLGNVGPISNPDAATQGAQGNVDRLMSGKAGGKLGEGIQVGVDQAARMVQEIDFPAFVAKLIEGTFHAIVKSSIEQMKAYADMVKSVATTLNEFKDRNTTDNQASDHLVSRYPQLFQINIVDNAPKVQARDDADTDHLPDFRKELGLAQQVSDLDDETIQNQLIPAARDDLARGRQQLLATIILMGINRIVVTDGKINAKIKFQFSANEKRNVSAQAYDYVSMGTRIDAQHQGEQQYTGPSSTPGQQGTTTTGANYYATGQDTMSASPDVRVTSQVDMSSDAKIQASGQIMGEVSVNFKSETFPLEKMVNTDQMLKIQEAGAGRGSLPAAAPGATPTAAASAGAPAAGATPAATPATTPPASNAPAAAAPAAAR